MFSIRAEINRAPETLFTKEPQLEIDVGQTIDWEFGQIQTGKCAIYKDAKFLREVPFSATHRPDLIFNKNETGRIGVEIYTDNYPVVARHFNVKLFKFEPLREIEEGQAVDWEFGQAQTGQCVVYKEGNVVRTIPFNATCRPDLTFNKNEVGSIGVEIWTDNYPVVARYFNVALRQLFKVEPQREIDEDQLVNWEFGQTQSGKCVVYKEGNVVRTCHFRATRRPELKFNENEMGNIRVEIHTGTYPVLARQFIVLARHELLPEINEGENDSDDNGSEISDIASDATVFQRIQYETIIAELQRENDRLRFNVAELTAALTRVRAESARKDEESKRRDESNTIKLASTQQTLSEANALKMQAIIRAETEKQARELLERRAAQLETQLAYEAARLAQVVSANAQQTAQLMHQIEEAAKERQFLNHMRGTQPNVSLIRALSIFRDPALKVEALNRSSRKPKYEEIHEFYHHYQQ